jgi:hypothetical protein
MPEELQRMLDLRAWLRGIGCCSMNSLFIAISTVEAETGRKCQDKAGCTCRHNCRELAAKNWSNRPKKERRG